MKSTQSLFKERKIKKVGGGQRGFLLQQISDCTDIPFDMILKNTFHLKGETGIKILEIILHDTLAFSEFKGARRDKAADMIRLSK